jgi:hypothetical protein
MLKKEEKKEQDILSQERVAAAIFSALLQHGTIKRKRTKNNFVKKESEWKKRRISGLR